MNKSERRNSLKHEDGADLISKLPDLILLLILSCLPSTEEVIRTSILSRRWRYLWTSIPSLNLNLRTRRSGDSQESKFKEFVNWVLLNRSVDLDRFRLSCGDYFGMSTVERWIHAAVMRNVKRLHLDFCPKETSGDVVMPHCLVTCASLEVLKLHLNRDRGLRLPNKVMVFPALRVLHLGYVELLDADSVEYFLESCPLLEDLTLEELTLEKIDLLCISSPKLKKLRFESRFHGCLKICCPNLMCLALTDYSALDIICERLYSLKEAIIRLKPKYIFQLFPGMSHLESLHSELYFLHESLDAAACSPALPNLKTLELSSTRFSFTVKNLTKILKHCPQLESLFLRVDNESLYDSWGFDGQEDEGKLDEAETKKILTSDVKWVESFKIKGERLKLDVSRSKRKWSCIVATWGKTPKYSHWMSRGYLND